MIKKVFNTGTLMLLVGIFMMLLALLSDDSSTLVTIGCTFIAVGCAMQNEQPKSKSL